MYLILDATHPDFIQIVSDMTEIYHSRNNSIFKPIYSFDKILAFVHIKEVGPGDGDIPSPLRDRITNITLRIVDKFFFSNEMTKLTSVWMPIDMLSFEAKRLDGTYKGERVEEIYRSLYWKDQQERDKEFGVRRFR
jgi:hypothetical protein